MDLNQLLNPADENVLPLIRELATFSEERAVLVPFNIQNHLLQVVEHLRDNVRNNNSMGRMPRVSVSHSESLVENREEEYDVKLNRETTLDILYRYPADTVLEYPETSYSGFVGHLFRIDPKNWINPILNVVYSRGKPAGQTVAGKEVLTEILVDAATGQKVPCVLSHTTCTLSIFPTVLITSLNREIGQGSKACAYSDIDVLSLPHVSATRADVKERLQNDREQRKLHSSPSRDVFTRTVAYLAAIRKLGCSRPLSEETFFLASEEEERETRALYLQQIQRGYRMREGICEGRMVFNQAGDNETEKPYIWQAFLRDSPLLICLRSDCSCEHYIVGSSKDHFNDFTIGNGTYDIDYIEAVITGDTAEALRIEEEARDLGYGPLIECTTVSNFSTQKAYCRM
jgi:hypothetical protein